MIKNLRRKGFTIVELVIVIAVIAILAAILIPTFSGIIKKANIASDTAMAKNMNTALVMADAEGKTVEKMSDVLFTLYEAGYVLENLNPTTNGYYFVWDESSNQILFLTDKFEVHYSSKAYSSDTIKWWMPMDQLKDVIESQQFSYCMAGNITGSIPKFNYLANFDTNGFTLEGNLEYDAPTALGSFTVAGIIKGKLTINTPLASVSHYGAIEDVNIIAVASASYHEYGFIKAVLTAMAGRVVIENTGNVTKIVIGAVALNIENKGSIEDVNVSAAAGADQSKFEAAAKLIVNNGYIKQLSTAITGLTTPTTPFANNSTSTKVNDKENFSVNIGSLSELESFRDSVNSGMRCEGITVKLTADIDMSNKYWIPIGLNNRDMVLFHNGVDATQGPANVFMGIFDGQGKTINGLSNQGYGNPSEKIYATNAAQVRGYHYGLFSVTYDAEIRNLNLTNVNIVNDVNGLFSVGAIVGATKGKFILENCSIKGNLAGLDTVGGAVGYVNVVNNSSYTNEYYTNKLIKFHNVSVDANIHAVYGEGASGNYAAGLIGRVNLVDLFSHYISATEYNVAAAGTNKFYITECTFKGNVIADNNFAAGLFTVVGNEVLGCFGTTPLISPVAQTTAALNISGNTVNATSIKVNGMATANKTLLFAGRFFSRINGARLELSTGVTITNQIKSNSFTGKIFINGADETTTFTGKLN